MRSEIWIGKYQATLESSGGVNMLCSLPIDQSPYTGANVAGARQLANARNQGGVSGFQVWDIYQLGILKTLFLIEFASADSQAVVDPGVTEEQNIAWGFSPTLSHSVNSPYHCDWRGYIGLWGGANQFVDGIYLSPGGTECWVLKNDGSGVYINTGASLQVGSNRPYKNLILTQGAGFNFADLFVPNETIESMAQSTFPDYASIGWRSAENAVLWSGGHRANNAGCGLFFFLLQNGASVSGMGSRLARV